MDEKTILIVGAVLAGAWYFTRKPAAGAGAGAGAAQAPGASTPAAQNAGNSTNPYAGRTMVDKPPTNGVGGYGSGEIGAHTITPEWILNSAGMGSGGRAPVTSPQASPVADPLASVAVPMPKIPVAWQR